MRPLALTIEGLTAFRNLQSIDFSELDLFVITGPTGSGKTSILDAVTFALYGDVCRVRQGELRDLISHGSAQVKVSLDFQVDGTSYRIARRLRRVGGAQEAALERIEGDKLLPVVDGRGVRAINNGIEQLLGLDFDAFTKAVLLPQGAFHEFLKGDPGARRRILIGLLELGRFERAGGKARERVRDLDARLDERRMLLQSEYQDATPAHLAELQTIHKRAKREHQSLRRAKEKADEKARVALSAETTAAAIRDAAPKLTQIDEELAAVADELPGLMQEADEATEAIGRTELVVGESETGLDEAKQKLEKTVARVGDEATLATLQAAAKTKREENVRAEALEKELASSSEDVQLAEEELAAARELLGGTKTTERRAAKKEETARKAREGAASSLTCAQAAGKLDRLESKLGAETEKLATLSGKAQQAAEHLNHCQDENMAAALRDGLRAGDPCPVCQSEIKSLPRTPRDVGALLQRARQAAEQAEGRRGEQANVVAGLKTQCDIARQALAEAQRVLPPRTRVPDIESAKMQLAETDVAFTQATTELQSAQIAASQAEARKVQAETKLSTAETQRDGFAREHAAATGRLADVTQTLHGTFGKNIPQDLDDELQTRAGELNRARTAVADADKALGAARSAREEALARLRQHERAVAAFDTRFAGISGRAEAVCGVLESAVGEVTGTPRPKRNATRESQVKEWNDCCNVYRTAATTAIRQREREAERTTFAIAQIIGPFGIETEGKDAAELVASLEAATNDGHAGVVRSEGEVSALQDKVARRNELEQTIANDSRLCERYRVLGRELQADHFIAFVLEESMSRLAELASVELLLISGERYSLVPDAGAFEVVDHHNADERRSVATLSGGETFLASLALALALSGSVRDLAGTAAAARLDAIFIDEGFGALDPETLEVVVDALERLREGERMVGVISHVPALAERVASGLVVERAGGSSRVVPR